MPNHALIVGISEYPPELGGELPAVIADVREMTDLLTSQNSRFDAAQVRSIVEAEATRDNILKGVREVFSAAAQDDTVFLYFAGHGTPCDGDYYFLPTDTVPGNIRGTAVGLLELRDALDGCSSERAVMMLDFCHSGGILTRGGPAGEDEDAKAIERAFKQVQGRGKAILTACTNDQKATELPNHGRFTYALLRGLRGEAADLTGEVTVNGLYDFADRNIGTPRQRPMFWGRMSGRIVLMKPASSTKPPTPAGQSGSSTRSPAFKSCNPVYKYLVESAETLCMFESWRVWTGHTLGSSPRWQATWLDKFQDFYNRVMQAVWPDEIPELERSLTTLALNLAMASKVFSRHCDAEEGDWLREVKFYKSHGWNKNYQKDLELYERWLEHQVHFVQESTKSANWVAEVVRRELDPLFFAVPGKFTVTAVSEMGASHSARVLEFTLIEKNAEPKAAMAAWDKMCDAAKSGARIY